MTVYVDEVMSTTPIPGKWPFKYSCHMLATTEEELHQFAQKLGLKRIWFQKHEYNSRGDHYGRVL